MIISDTEFMKSLHHSDKIQLLQVIENRMKLYLVMKQEDKLTPLKHVSKCSYLEEEGEAAHTLFRELTMAI